MTSEEQPFSDIEATLKKAAAALRAAGLRAEDPSDEWLVKAWDGDVLVDLIFSPEGPVMDDDVIEHHRRCDGLLEGLEIIPPARDAPEAGACPEPRVRVVTSAGSAPAEAG